MDKITLPRRGFILGLAGAFCAPAIVKASSLMRVSPFDERIPVDLIITDEFIPSYFSWVPSYYPMEVISYRYADLFKRKPIEDIDAWINAPFKGVQDG